MFATGDLVVASGTFTLRGLFTRFWRWSCPAAGTSKPPVIAVHGGPAFTHNYMLPLKLLARSGREVIFYDQCGCGDSSFVADPKLDAPWLLTVAFYVEELHALVAELRLERFYTYGSSWGSQLALEFALTQPTGLLGQVRAFHRRLVSPSLTLASIAFVDPRRRSLRCAVLYSDAVVGHSDAVDAGGDDEAVARARGRRSVHRPAICRDRALVVDAVHVATRAATQVLARRADKAEQSHLRRSVSLHLSLSLLSL